MRTVTLLSYEIEKGTLEAVWSGAARLSCTLGSFGDFKNNFIHLFIFAYAESSLPCGLFSSCGKWGLQ